MRLVFAVVLLAKGAHGASFDHSRRLRLRGAPWATVATGDATYYPGVPGPASFAMCGCPALNDCTCNATLAHLQCLTLACSAGCPECAGQPQSFANQCTDLGSPLKCGGEIGLNCTSGQAQCRGLYHQLPASVTGLRMRAQTMGVGLYSKGDGVYCGPHGKCLGDLTLEADVHRGQPGAWFECAVPTGAPSIGNVSAEVRCGAPVNGSFASCIVPMVGVRLDANGTIKGSCWLSNTTGTALTQKAEFVLQNSHD